MRCLVCGETIERRRSWEHIRSVHLEPIDLTQEKIFEHAKKIAHPMKVRTAYITCIDLRKNIIFFSLDNAELLIAFAREHGNIPWMEVVEWQMLHEKAHIACRDLYETPNSVKSYVLVNAEDYYINKYLIPEKYWRVCLMNAKCSTEIRNISPMPYNLRDGYYYCTLATFIAYDAVTLGDLNFLNLNEARFVESISAFFKKIKEAKHVSSVSKEIEGAFKRLNSPRGCLEKER
jgi:hypothetical protein